MSMSWTHTSFGGKNQQNSHLSAQKWMKYENFRRIIHLFSTSPLSVRCSSHFSFIRCILLSLFLSEARTEGWKVPLLHKIVDLLKASKDYRTPTNLRARRNNGRVILFGRNITIVHYRWWHCSIVTNVHLTRLVFSLLPSITDIWKKEE